MFLKDKAIMIHESEVHIFEFSPEEYEVLKKYLSGATEEVRAMGFNLDLEYKVLKVKNVYFYGAVYTGEIIKG